MKLLAGQEDAAVRAGHRDGLDDSAPDENAQKQRRGEFLAALAPVLGSAEHLVAGMPEATDFAVETLKFATAPFRAGRSLEGAIDELGERLKARGQQNKPNPEAEGRSGEAEGRAGAGADRIAD